MNNDPVAPVVTETTNANCLRSLHYSLCWGAVLAGTVAAIGIHLLMTALGVGAGLATFSPMTDANPAENFSVGAAIVWTICALVALWFGGFVAGRFSKCQHSGFVHGVLVWSLTLIITVLLLSMGTGMVLGGAMKVLGEGLGIGAKAAASTAGDFAKEGLQRSGDQMNSFIQEATESVPTNASPKAATRAKREVGFAIAKLFTPGNDVNSPENRMAAVTALMQYTEMSQPDAQRTVDDWTRSYKNLEAELDRAKAAAEQKAREVADKAARHLACAALWSFFALLIGLLVTACGGRCGGKCSMRHTEIERSTTRV